jgi:hypothetical protein
MKHAFYGMLLAGLVAAAPAMADDQKADVRQEKHRSVYSDLRNADRDNDGIVTRAEYAAEMDRCFEKMDTDGDGQLSRTEVDHCKQGPPYDGQEKGGVKKVNDAEGTPNAGGTEKNQVGGRAGGQNKAQDANTGSNERENKN